MNLRICFVKVLLVLKYFIYTKVKTEIAINTLIFVNLFARSDKIPMSLMHQLNPIELRKSLIRRR